MDRREFLTLTGAVAAFPMRNERAANRFRLPPSAFRIDPQAPSLSPAVFSRRIARLQAELKTRKWDLLLVTPGTTFRYCTGYDPGRSERLIALIVPVTGDPTIVCPSFEVDRLKEHTSIADIAGWDERDDPYKVVQGSVDARKFRSDRTLGLESSTTYATYLGLKHRLSGWKFEDAAPLIERVRIIKAPEEIELIRRAVAITEDALAATFAQLSVGITDRDVARLLAAEMVRRGADSGGDGLVQFGPASALPHGGPTGATLERETVVLIDCGCRVDGYTSDITRTIWFGDHPSEEFRRIFDLVYDAQTAAMQLAKPLATQCQEMDRAARKVIADGGHGPEFTHRLGHGIGLDVHEPPFLVEGNDMRLEPGMVFTIEPGIYQVGKFGVRIEDDAVMTDRGLELLSHRPAKP